MDNAPKTLGERIKSIRGEMQQAEFAAWWGIHKNSLANYERGVSFPTVDKIHKLLNMFPEISPAWLLTGEGSQSALQTGSAKEGFVMFQRCEIDRDTATPRHLESNQLVDHIAFKSEWIDQALRVPRKDLALIGVKGDSMSPSLNDGDLVLVDLRAARIEDSAIYVIEFDDSLLVKRIHRKLDGTIVVKGDNAHYEPEVLSQERAESLKIVGRVIWAGRRM